MKNRLLLTSLLEKNPGGSGHRFTLTNGIARVQQQLVGCVPTEGHAHVTPSFAFSRLAPSPWAGLRSRPPMLHSN